MNIILYCVARNKPIINKTAHLRPQDSVWYADDNVAPNMCRESMLFDTCKDSKQEGRDSDERKYLR